MYICIYLYIYMYRKALCDMFSWSCGNIFPKCHLPRSAAGRGGIGRAARRTWHLGQIYWGWDAQKLPWNQVEKSWNPHESPLNFLNHPKPSKSWFQLKQDPIQLVDAPSQSRWSSRAPVSVPTSSVCGAACAICAAGEASFGLVIGFPWGMVLPHREALLSSR